MKFFPIFFSLVDAYTKKNYVAMWEVIVHLLKKYTHIHVDFHQPNEARNNNNKINEKNNNTYIWYAEKTYRTNREFYLFIFSSLFIFIYNKTTRVHRIKQSLRHSWFLSFVCSSSMYKHFACRFIVCVQRCSESDRKKKYIQI